ncbi:MAG: hypothetical protein QOF62_289 [Pyrinomonadaceae bacterium]|nr:hypothetical protein [Pyrinomonadaceae bacterium]
MICPSGKGHEHSAVKTEAGHLVANALFSFWRRGFDGPAELLKRRPFITTYPGKVFVYGLWFS